MKVERELRGNVNHFPVNFGEVSRAGRSVP
jgi:hypothetical protein